MGKQLTSSIKRLLTKSMSKSTKKQLMKIAKQHDKDETKKNKKKKQKKNKKKNKKKKTRTFMKRGVSREGREGIDYKTFHIDLTKPSSCTPKRKCKSHRMKTPKKKCNESLVHFLNL